jgi:hypothetical protein
MYPQGNSLHLSSLRNKISSQKSRLFTPHHFTPHHFTYLHSTPTWKPLLVTTFLTLFLTTFLTLLYTYITLWRKREKSGRWWQRQLYTSREGYSGSSLLADLDFQSVSGLCKNFTGMSPSKFEFLVNLIGEKFWKKNTAFRKAISVQGWHWRYILWHFPKTTPFHNYQNAKQTAQHYR